MEIELTIQTKETGAIEVLRLPIRGRVVLGRGPDSPVALDGPLISREHLAFEEADGQLAIFDLSSNGVWLNHQRLRPQERYTVSEADQITAPGYEIRCLILSEKPVPALSSSVSPAAPPPAPKVTFLSSISTLDYVVLAVFVAAVVVVLIAFKY